MRPFGITLPLKTTHRTTARTGRYGSDELSVTEAASRLGCTRQALSRRLNGKAGVSPAMALALEGIGWSNAGFWMRLQSSYELAQARLDRAAAERRAGALHA